MQFSSETNVYSRTLIRLMVPIAIQQFFAAGLALVDNMLVGQLGETAVASVSLANQVFFVYSIILFGVNSGSAIFTAQFWGNNDTASIRKVVGINLTINLIIGTLFVLISELIPQVVLRLYTNDPAVIALGSQFLRVYALGFIFFGISYGFYSLLRSTESVKIPMIVNSLVLIINTALGYILIFGKFGFQPMGAMGAATASVTARVLEIGTMLVILFWGKSFITRDLRHIFPVKKEFLLRFARTTAPVVFNEVVWSVGITTYSSIYAHISTEAVAATNISSTIENLAFVPFIGIINACAIMLGNRIGASEMELAKRYARRTLILTLILGLTMGGLMFISRGILLDIYKVSADTRSYANIILIALSIGMVIKSINALMFVGVLRAGGDTRTALLIEISTIWLVGVPSAWIGANVFHLPVYWV